MTHIMVDLETWGTTPGSDIRSIGAVVFDPVAGTLGDEFYTNVYQGNFYGLARDPDTVEWWAQQSEAAQQRLLIDQQPIHHGLALFAEWWVNHCPHAHAGETPATFWANGPHFDEAILAACYRAVSQRVPWHYRAPRDCRTIWEVGGGIDVPFEGIEHDALADAKHQARCVIEAYRRLRAPIQRACELESRASMLRAAQRAYMTDRGNDELGRAVAEAAANLDQVLGVAA